MIDIAGVPPSLLRSLPHVLSILLAHTQRGGHVVSGCGNAVRLASSAAVSLAHSQHRCQGCYGCVHTYTWIYICVVVCMCIYIFISMCVNIYIYMYMHVSKHIFIYMNSLVHRLSHRNITKSKTDLTHTHTRAEFRCLRAHIMQMNLMWLLLICVVFSVLQCRTWHVGAPTRITVHQFPTAENRPLCVRMYARAFVYVVWFYLTIGNCTPVQKIQLCLSWQIHLACAQMYAYVCVYACFSDDTYVYLYIFIRMCMCIPLFRSSGLGALSRIRLLFLHLCPFVPRSLFLGLSFPSSLIRFRLCWKCLSLLSLPSSFKSPSLSPQPSCSFSVLLIRSTLQIPYSYQIYREQCWTQERDILWDYQ